MSTRSEFKDQDKLYFISCSVIGRLNQFTRNEYQGKIFKLMCKSLPVGGAKMIIAALLLLSAAAAMAQPQFRGFENLLSVPRSCMVGYTKTAPVIDGDITDAAWQQAKWIDDLVDIEGDLKPMPPLKTGFKMLWDDTCLYIATRVNDPHVWAYMKQRDDVVFHENDVEVFINPNNTTHLYYEIECNAINTIFDLFLNKPYRNGGRPLGNWDAKGLRSAVKVQGTVNDPADTDTGWTMEMAIPFKALGAGKGIKEGTMWRFNLSRVEWDTKVAGGRYEKMKDADGRNLPEHNWVWSPQGLVNMHYPERWGYLQFTKNTDSPAKFTLPYAELQKQYLWLVYYKQRAWVKEHGVYALSLKELDISPDAVVSGNPNGLALEATPHQFMAFITDKKDNLVYTIDQDGYVALLAMRQNE